MGRAGRIGGIFEIGVFRRCSLSAGMVSNFPADGQGLLFEKNGRSRALNFLCEPQMQSCFMPGKGVVGSMKYQRLPILTKADNS